MDFESVRIFVDVIKQGSFASVARQRNVDPSSISRAISALESQLGFRLFQRSTRKLSATEAGNEYYLRVQNLIGEFDQAGEAALDLVSLPTGTLNGPDRLYRTIPLNPKRFKYINSAARVNIESPRTGLRNLSRFL